MKKLEPALINLGADILDGGNWSEFVTFVRTKLPDERQREACIAAIQVYFEKNRGLAIKIWRTSAEAYVDDADLSERTRAARAVLNEHRIGKTLSPDQLRRTEIIFGALVAELLAKDPRPQPLEQDVIDTLFAAAIVHSLAFAKSAYRLEVVV